MSTAVEPNVTDLPSVTGHLPESSLSEGFTNTADREVAWRRIKGVHKYDGVRVDSVPQVFSDLGLDFAVTTEPVYAKIGDMFYPVTGKQAIVREGRAPSVAPDGSETPAVEPLIYGLAGSRYRPLQNREIADLLNPLLANWTLDAVASLNEGRDLLTVFKAEDFSVNGEQLTEYFWVREGKSGTAALEFAIVPVRLWCTNQLVTGMRSASFSAGIVHGQGVQNDARFHINVFELLDSARQKLRVSFAQMGQVALDNEQVAEIIERVFPEPSMPKRLQMLQDIAQAANVEGSDLDAHLRERINADQLDAISSAQYEYENQMARTPVMRQDALTLVERFNDLHSDLANTPWGVYNAVVELMDFGGQERGDATAKSALFGDRAAIKTRAFAAAMAVTDPQWEKQGNYVPGLVARSHRSRGGGRRTARAPRAPRVAVTRTLEELETAEQERQQAINQRGADRFNAAVAAGTREPLRDDQGEAIVMTADRWAQYQLEAQEARQQRLLKALENTKKSINARTLTLAERIALRNDRRAEQIAKRSIAQEQLHTLLAQAEQEATAAEATDDEDTDDEDTDDEDTDDDE